MKILFCCALLAFVSKTLADSNTEAAVDSYWSIPLQDSVATRFTGSTQEAGSEPFRFTGSTLAAAEDESNATTTAIIAGAAAGALLIGVAGGGWWLKKRRENSSFDEVEEEDLEKWTE